MRPIDLILADILAVRIEIASPWSAFRFGERGATRRPTTEAVKALAILEAELVAAQAALITTNRVRQIRLYSRGGFSNNWYA